MKQVFCPWPVLCIRILPALSDVVNKIAETDTDWNDAPLDPQVIRTITVDTFGVDYPEPEKC